VNKFAANIFLFSDVGKKKY